MNLFNLFAKISLDDKEYNKGVDDAERKGRRLGKSFSAIGGGLKTMGTMAVGTITAATAAVGTLTVASVKQYAEFEQLVGGVETLFKDSAKVVERYAANAFRSAGLSSNQYMTLVTSFSASLLQGLGGDTKKAADLSNQAIIDMSDNANKMGTSMEMIQNAYNGFAKANFTMLDNLKLGYGGTKSEMQRLLVDAEKLTGIKYDINNFADIINGINVIQTELGITGTTAKEAEETISGSFNAMKGAFSNFITRMADDTANYDDLINDLVDTVGTFGGNVLPVVEKVLGKIGETIPLVIEGFSELGMSILPSLMKTAPKAINALVQGLLNGLPVLISSGVSMIKSLVEGITNSLPTVMQSALEIMDSLINGLVEVLPMLIQVGLQALITLGQGIAQALPTLIPTLVNLVVSMCDMIIANLPLILDVAVDIILALIQGLISALPTLISEVPRIINAFAKVIYDSLPQILAMGVEIIVMLVKGLIDSIPIIIQNLPQIIMAIINAFTLINWWNVGSNVLTGIWEGMKAIGKNLMSWAGNFGQGLLNGLIAIFKNAPQVGKNLITWLGNGITSMVSWIVNSAGSMASNVINTIANFFSWSNMANIGKNLVQGIWNGIANMGGWLLDRIAGWAGSILNGIKGFFGIHSPSRVMRDEVGKYMAQGVGVGFEEEMDEVNADIQNSLTSDFEVPEGAQESELGTVIALLVQLVNKDNNTYLDGKQLARGLSPYQSENDRYNSRNPSYAY